MKRRKNILLYPLSLLYGGITAARNFLYDAGILPTDEFSFPVICVGNITVGGTGKTPHTEYIAAILKEHFRVAVLSRGYKRKTRDFRIVSAESQVSESGDETLQMCHNLPGAIVAVDRNRVHGIDMILDSHPEVEVVILDDGYKHRRLTPGYSILLSDYERMFYKDHLLPYGNLRESKANMRRADIILITKTPANITPIPVFNPDQVKNKVTITGNSDTGIVLVTGIANPQPLKEHLEKSFHEITHLEYSDHHNFTEKDIAAITDAYNNLKSRNRFLFTTEKDAVRLREFANIAEPMKSSFFYIPVGIYFLNEDKDEFDNLIIDYVRKNHRNNRLSEGKRIY